MLLLSLGGGAWRSRPTMDSIASIQGAGPESPLTGRQVATEGVVTAVTADGFYLQDPRGDGDPGTSEGIFVEHAGPVAAGDRVRLSATVVEASTGGSPAALRVTRLIRASSVEVVSRREPLPRAVVIGAEGRAIPRGSVPDAIDFLESLEGMRVILRRPAAISPTESRGGGRSDLFVHPDPGGDREDRHAFTAAGGVLLRSGPDNLGDQNTDRIRIAFDPVLHPDSVPIFSVGDRMADVTGIVDYAYGAYQVRPVAPVTVARRSPWRPQVTALRRAADHLTLASYNVLNLSADSSDQRQRARLASQIVRSLRSPDILALQEIQDASGERDDGVVDARPTLRALAGAVIAAGGPAYAYVDAAPADGRPGGVPGGNIRNAFLYDSSRVRLVAYRPLTAAVLQRAGAPSPDAFSESRDPLEAVFEVEGRRLWVINNHLTSRFGSTPVFGAIQPWVQAGEARREQQVRALNAYVRGLLKSDADARVVVLGDMNTFETSDDLSEILPGRPPVLANLLSRVPEAERYTYNFEGNSQALDHIFVTGSLSTAEVDVVHLNVDFASAVPASDHEPVVARFRR